MLNVSHQSVVRRAQQVIAQRASARVRPLVQWAGLDENSCAFAERLTEVRRTNACRILAVCPFGFTVPTGCQAVPLPEKMFRLLHPSVRVRYRCASGGRGSGKSHSIATVIILLALSRTRLRILAAREIMRSLRESVHHLLCDKIDALKLSAFFDITDRAITCTATGSQVIFAGLWAHISTLKSLENIGLVWIEESESVSARSLEVLTPTIRAADSEIWMSCNPDSPDAPVMGFIDGKRDDVSHVHVIHTDNPWFGQTPLEAERAYLERVDDDAYQHVWLGKCRTVSDALIFKNKFFVEDFTAHESWSQYHGCDFGFSQDPSAAVRAYVSDRTLYISHEFWGLHVELDDLSKLIEAAIPGSQDARLYCDCARPESISYLSKHGHPWATSAPKWSGSLVDGVMFLRSFERIVVHPRCRRTLDELRSYSFRIDKLTNLPTTEPEDRNNHLIDALRYAMSDLIKPRPGEGIIAYYQKMNADVAAAKAAAMQATEASRPTMLERIRGLNVISHS